MSDKKQNAIIFIKDILSKLEDNQTCVEDFYCCSELDVEPFGSIDKWLTYKITGDKKYNFHLQVYNPKWKMGG